MTLVFRARDQNVSISFFFYVGVMSIVSCMSPTLPRYLEYRVFRDCADGVGFITPDVTQFIKLYEGLCTQ